MRSLTSAIVDELHGEVEVGILDERHDTLKVISTRAGDAQLIARDLGLDLLRTFIADEFGELFGLLLADALFQLAGDLVQSTR